MPVSTLQASARPGHHPVCPQAVHLATARPAWPHTSASICTRSACCLLAALQHAAVHAARPLQHSSSRWDQAWHQAYRVAAAADLQVTLKCTCRSGCKKQRKRSCARPVDRHGGRWNTRGLGPVRLHCGLCPVPALMYQLSTASAPCLPLNAACRASTYAVLHRVRGAHMRVWTAGVVRSNV